jgi:hypothetical protein
MNTDHQYPPDCQLLALLFPMRTDGLDELAKIVKDAPPPPAMKRNGELLDGRRRREACRMAGVPLPTVEYTGTDPEAFVIATHAQQCCLYPSQRAMAGAKYANLSQGRPGGNPPTGGFNLTQAQAAAVLGTSVRAIQRAKAVIAKDPELAEEVWRGETTLAAAEKKLNEPAPENTPGDNAGDQDPEQRTESKALKQLRRGWKQATEEEQAAFRAETSAEPEPAKDDEQYDYAEALGENWEGAPDDDRAAFVLSYLEEVEAVVAKVKAIREGDRNSLEEIRRRQAAERRAA